MPDKPKLSMYWASSCGGCEIALTNIHEKILDVDAAFDFIFCPCLLDTKKADIERLPENDIALTLFNGAIRTDENEEMAHILREKSQILVSFGSCSYEGCIPALSNFSSREDHFRTIYLDNPTIDNPTGIIPQPSNTVAEGEIIIPEFHERVKTLSQVVDVDYSIPGCPPEPHQIWAVVEKIVNNEELPPKGSVIGAGISTVCDECKRTKSDKKIDKLYRTYEIIPDTDACLLEQGIICMGIATRDGCGGLCPQVNMPCTGCYGPPEGVQDQGARMVSALGSVINIEDKKDAADQEITARINSVLDSVPDYGGTFYKYSLADSILKGKVQ